MVKYGKGMKKYRQTKSVIRRGENIRKFSSLLAGWVVNVLNDSCQFGILNGDGRIEISFWNRKSTLFKDSNMLFHPPFCFVKAVLN